MKIFNGVRDGDLRFLKAREKKDFTPIRAIFPEKKEVGTDSGALCGGIPQKDLKVTKRTKTKIP